MDPVLTLQAELERARAEAAKWERAYRALHDQLAVRAMLAARRAGIELVHKVRSNRGPRPVTGATGAGAVPTAPFGVPFRAPAGTSSTIVARLDPAIGERRFQAFDAVLRLFPTGRLVDLGTGHGLLAKRAADAGWQVTAVDARTERFPSDERITWVHQDIREHDLSGYDLILCLGLFYHLTLADQLDLLRRASGKPLLIDTHVDVGIQYPDNRLGGSVEQDGYRGRLYGEHLESPLASWVNEASFWPDLDSFYRMLADNGYPVTLALEPWYQPERTFFLALPQPS